MLIKSVRVQNYRCILDETLVCETLTVLVGPSGCGKSAFLRATELFFDDAPKITSQDFYNRDTTQAIEITCVLGDLPDALDASLAPYVCDGELEITRVIEMQSNRTTSRFYGAIGRHGGFQTIREAGRAADQKALYQALHTEEAYAALPAWTIVATLNDNLATWERANPDRCSRQRDDGTTFNSGLNGPGDVGQYVHVVFIPAVRDAGADATDARGSALTDLLDVAFRARIFERADFRALQASVEDQYASILESAKNNEFKAIEERLSSRMGSFMSNATIRLDWARTDHVTLPIPNAKVLISEDDFESPVSAAGHGVQRAFILALLQELAFAKLQSAPATAPPNTTQGADEALDVPDSAPLPLLLLVIEEPELFQHPNRQRVISKTLNAFADGTIGGVTDQTQVICATHNAHFVAIDRAEQVRVLKKVERAGGPRVTRVRRINTEAFVDSVHAGKDAGEDRREWAVHVTRLRSIMNLSINEGFFASGIVLVEGDIDRSAIVAACDLEGMNLEDLGISVVGCNGKSALSRLMVLFEQLDIPVYVVWDADGDKKKTDERKQNGKENRELLRMVGATVVDFPATAVASKYSVFATNLESEIKTELGKFFSTFMAESFERYGLTADDRPIKQPTIFRDMLMDAKSVGISSATLDLIVAQVRAMAAAL